MTATIGQTLVATGVLHGWHFAGPKLRDGRPLPKAGETLHHEGACVPCESGLHFSTRAIDALAYAPGPFVAQVSGPANALPHGDPDPVDKHCGTWRRCESDYVDVTRVLHEWACWCATRALDAEEAAGRAVDPRSREAIRVKLAWLDGKATDQQLAAARVAAWAAQDAARVAARDAAARDVAWAAEREAQKAELERRLTAALAEAGVKP